ncbi:MAG: hypothetical protein QHC40_11365 [Sphingobium sp.]|nr:hypothetical protein [Sphingobium sp.]
MNRYFFHIYNDDITLDDEGVELPDLNAARQRALREARLLAAESVVEHGHLILHHRIDIAMADETVATVRFGDAIQVQA